MLGRTEQRGIFQCVGNGLLQGHGFPLSPCRREYLISKGSARLAFIALVNDPKNLCCLTYPAHIPHGCRNAEQPRRPIVVGGEDSCTCQPAKRPWHDPLVPEFAAHQQRFVEQLRRFVMIALHSCHQCEAGECKTECVTITSRTGHRSCLCPKPARSGEVGILIGDSSKLPESEG